MRYIIISFFISVFISCKAQTNDNLESRDIILKDLTKDSVLIFLKNTNDTLSILREVEIFQNDNKDTIILGYSIIPPKFTGKIWFIQDNLNPSSAVYLDRTKELDINDPVSFSKLFTIGLWNHKYDKGFEKIGIRVRLK
jgi:hypothetical protein